MNFKVEMIFVIESLRDKGVDPEITQVINFPVPNDDIAVTVIEEYITNMIKRGKIFKNARFLNKDEWWIDYEGRVHRPPENHRYEVDENLFYDPDDPPPTLEEILSDNIISAIFFAGLNIDIHIYRKDHQL